jgi:hypothetical protein
MRMNCKTNKEIQTFKIAIYTVVLVPAHRQNVK